jgi:Flp pilus assembly protein TadG
VRLRVLRRLRDEERGAAAIEFALLVPPFLMLLMGSFDMAYQAYVRSTAQGAVETLTRSATIQGADEAAIKKRLEDTVHQVAPRATVAITRGSVSRFSNFDAMERLTLDLNNNGALDGPVDTDNNGIKDKSDCWEDIDDNGIRNVVLVGKDGIGGADDIVRYNVQVTFDRLFPVWKLFNMPMTATVSAATLVRRQPYEAQKAATIRCAQ